MIKGKKIFLAVIIFTMLFGMFAIPVSAIANDSYIPETAIEDLTEEGLEYVAEELNISVYELENLETIFEQGFIELTEAENMNADSFIPSDTVTVQISENLVLESTLEVEEVILPFLSRSNTTRRTQVTGTRTLSNVFGMTIVTINSFGVWNWNNTTVTFVDQGVTHSAVGWNVTNSRTRGGNNSSRWVRHEIRARLRIGVDGINIPIQSRDWVHRIEMNARGVWTSTWN